MAALSMTIPQSVRIWIHEMVRGTTSVEVPHMLYATQENFQNVKFQEGLSLIRRRGPVKEWLDQCDDKAAGMRSIACYVAYEVHEAVLDLFETARYQGD